MMETLLVVAQQGNQYHCMVKSNGRAVRVGSSPPSRKFREINCRTFESGAGILPNPCEFYSTPVIKHAPPPSPNSNTASPSATDVSHVFESETPLSKTTPIPIKTTFAKSGKFCNDEMFEEENLSFSERWAGPAYSNSPPPSSLPIPKFSVKAKRTVSLDLPKNSDIAMEFLHPTASSAPASPTRAHKPSARDFFTGVDSATKTLRRILNLDATDE